MSETQELSQHTDVEAHYDPDSIWSAEYALGVLAMVADAKDLSIGSPVTLTLIWTEEGRWTTWGDFIVAAIRQVE
jgi:hypothetical protein